MSAVWRRYLLVGIVVAAGCVLLPLGFGRDFVYCLIGASSVVAIVVGVRRYRPSHPVAWYIIAAGAAVGGLGDALYSWYQHVVLIEPFLSSAIVLHFGAYPLLAVGLLVLVRSRGSVPAPAALRRAVGMRRSGARWRTRGTARSEPRAGTRSTARHPGPRPRRRQRRGTTQPGGSAGT